MGWKGRNWLEGSKYRSRSLYGESFTVCLQSTWSDILGMFNSLECYIKILRLAHLTGRGWRSDYIWWDLVCSKNESAERLLFLIRFGSAKSYPVCLQKHAIWYTGSGYMSSSSIYWFSCPVAPKWCAGVNDLWGNQLCYHRIKKQRSFTVCAVCVGAFITL